MSTWAIALIYCAVFVLAAWLLWRFSHVRWYWHLMSVLIALGIGLIPMRESWNRPTIDLLFGSVILLLLIWGAGEWAFRWFHIHRHA